MLKYFVAMDIAKVLALLKIGYSTSILVCRKNIHGEMLLCYNTTRWHHHMLTVLVYNSASVSVAVLTGDYVTCLDRLIVRV